MEDSRRENVISHKCVFCEEKTCDFCLNGGFEKTRDFQVKCWFLEEKTHDFRLNGEFEKRKFVIFT